MLKKIAIIISLFTMLTPQVASASLEGRANSALLLQTAANLANVRYASAYNNQYGYPYYAPVNYGSFPNYGYGSYGYGNYGYGGYGFNSIYNRYPSYAMNYPVSTAGYGYNPYVYRPIYQNHAYSQPAYFYPILTLVTNDYSRFIFNSSTTNNQTYNPSVYLPTFQDFTPQIKNDFSAGNEMIGGGAYRMNEGSNFGLSSPLVGGGAYRMNEPLETPMIGGGSYRMNEGTEFFGGGAYRITEPSETSSLLGGGAFRMNDSGLTDQAVGGGSYRISEPIDTSMIGGGSFRIDNGAIGSDSSIGGGAYRINE